MIDNDVLSNALEALSLLVLENKGLRDQLDNDPPEGFVKYEEPRTVSFDPERAKKASEARSQMRVRAPTLDIAAAIVFTHAIVRGFESRSSDPIDWTRVQEFLRQQIQHGLDRIDPQCWIVRVESRGAAQPQFYVEEAPAHPEYAPAP